MSAAHFGLRAARNTFRPSAFSQNARFASRRFQSSTAEAAADATKTQGGFAKFWNSPIGPKTVHFWAPIMKWGVVLAGASDFARPAKDLSISQNAALMATGAIWTRWCFVIRPQNLFLASVNFLLFCVGATQVSRVLMYQQSLKGGSIAQEAEGLAKEEGKDLGAAVKKAENAAKQ